LCIALATDLAAAAKVRFDGPLRAMTKGGRMAAKGRKLLSIELRTIHPFFELNSPEARNRPAKSNLSGGKSKIVARRPQTMWHFTHKKGVGGARGRRTSANNNVLYQYVTRI